VSAARHRLVSYSRGTGLVAGATLTALALLGAPAADAQQGTLVVRNNHEIPYRGPADLTVDLADGRYVGPNATADVRGGRAHLFATLPAKSAVTLTRAGAPVAKAFAHDGPFSIAPSPTSLALRWHARSLGDVALGLVVIPGDTATTDAAVRAFAPTPITWTSTADGALRGAAERDGYSIAITARPYDEGWLDVRANVVRRAPTSTSPAYVALVRRVVTPSPSEARMRFNGRELDGATTPDTWEGDFRYVHGVDWVQWKTGATTLLSVNGFTPTPSVKHGSTWAEASHFYVWELTRPRGDTTYLVSEIAGPNTHQSKKGYMAVAPYAEPVQGDTVALKWRLAANDAPPAQWGEIQLREFSGARLVSRAGDTVRADIGVPYVTFGISYFPYSTFTENFDFYRVPAVTSEGFWATSPVMWKQWRTFIPRMRTDLHIVRAMGFDMVRLHHLELLQTLDRADALAFLDFYANESRALGLKWLVDTEGPPEWVSAVLRRYADLVTRVELENENLIPGIKPEEPARWSAMYAAAKRAAPAAQVYLTGAGNNSMFDRLRQLGVPFDRVGLHAYKHGPAWKEAYRSHMLGSAGYATELGKAVTLGEFNWKDLTRFSPEVQAQKFAEIYRQVLAPRAIPEVLEFQFHEDLAFNPAVAGTVSRHYEPLGLDRRPKQTAFVAMELMRKYERPDAPTRQMPVHVSEVQFVSGTAEATFTVTNNTNRAQRVMLTPIAFDGTTTRLITPSSLMLAPHASANGRVALSLPAAAKPGTYHHFIEAKYDSAMSIGWGVASNEGAPTFADSTVLGDRVTYAQGLGVVHGVKWKRPLAVIFGDKSPALELEDAYQLANTLQAATGTPVWVSSEKDLPDSLASHGTVLLVGTPATNALVASTRPVTPTAPGRGTIALDRNGGREWLVLTGSDAKGVEAAVVELELRYWPNAKDAVVRVTGLEKGAALGNRAGGVVIDPP
jgi:hypothetical protein